MSLIFNQKISDLAIIDGIATETTLATFKASGSAKEGVILKASGAAVPTTKENVLFSWKDSLGRMTTSAVIPGGAKILNVSKTSPTTAVPGYSYFTPDVTGAAAGDLVEVFMKIMGGYGSDSLDNWISETIMYTFQTGDTALKVAQGITRQAHLDLSSNYYLNNAPKVVYNNAGFAKVYSTEAVALADKANVDNDDLIYVIENLKPYVIIDDTATTFATLASEKTDWSTEIAAETAEYVNNIKYYDFIHTTAGVTYVINKPGDTRPELLDGTVPPVYVGAEIKDASNNFEQLSEWSATRIGEQTNLTSGIKIKQLEKFVAFDNYPGGDYSWKEFEFTPSSVATTDYYVVNVEFETFTNDRSIARVPLKQVIQIACSVEANADTLVTAFELARDGA